MKWALNLNPSSPAPKYQQLVDIVLERISSGELGAGDRIPSVVELARMLNVSKPTVVQAFRELESQGLLVTVVGRGSFIASGVAKGSNGLAAAAMQATKPVPAGRPEGLSSVHQTHRMTSQRLLSLPVGPRGVDLRIATPPQLEETQGLFRRAATKAAQLPLDDLFGYAERGHPELLAEIGRWHLDRGLEIGPEHVLVTNGAQGAIALLSQWCANRGRAIGHESPTCLSFPLLMRQFGLDPIEVDRWSGGFDPDSLDRLAQAPSALLCTPDFQNPTGLCLDDEQRAQVAELARSSDVVVAIDEVFRELRFHGTDLPSMFDMLPPNRRILINSFSKTFMPGLRVGYIVADEELVTELLALRREMDLGSPRLTQATMAFALAEGLEDVLDAARDHYRSQVAVLETQLRENLTPGTRFDVPEGGYHFWVNLPDGVSSLALYFRLLGQDIAIRPGPTLDVAGRFDNAFRLSFGHTSTGELTEAARAIADAIAEMASTTADWTAVETTGVLY